MSSMRSWLVILSCPPPPNPTTCLLRVACISLNAALIAHSPWPCCPPTHAAPWLPPPPGRRMEDFNRERQLYSLAISPQFVPMMYFCEVRSSCI